MHGLRTHNSYGWGRHRKVLNSDYVYQDLVTRAANNPCADTLLNLSVHCSVMARLAKGEGDIAAWAIYEREVCDWLDAYLKWGSTWVR